MNKSPKRTGGSQFFFENSEQYLFSGSVKRQGFVRHQTSCDQRGTSSESKQDSNERGSRRHSKILEYWDLRWNFQFVSAPDFQPQSLQAFISMKGVFFFLFFSQHMKKEQHQTVTPSNMHMVSWMLTGSTHWGRFFSSEVWGPSCRCSGFSGAPSCYY